MTSSPPLPYRSHSQLGTRGLDKHRLAINLFPPHGVGNQRSPGPGSTRHIENTTTPTRSDPFPHDRFMTRTLTISYSAQRLHCQDAPDRPSTARDCTACVVHLNSNSSKRGMREKAPPPRATTTAVVSFSRLSFPIGGFISQPANALASRHVRLRERTEGGVRWENLVSQMSQ